MPPGDKTSPSIEGLFYDLESAAANALEEAETLKKHRTGSVELMLVAALLGEHHAASLDQAL